MRVLLSTLASAAFGQDLFLGRAASCELAALAGNWVTTHYEGRYTAMNASITLNTETCVLSGQFFYDQTPFQLTNFQPANFSPDLFEAVGWRQSGDNAVQGFQARGSVPDSRDHFVGWLDPSTQSVTFYRYNAGDVRAYDFHSFWVRSGPAGRGAPAMDALPPAAAQWDRPMGGVAEPDPCEGKWPTGLLSLLPWGGRPYSWDVSSSAVTISPGSWQNHDQHFGYMIADRKTCKVMGSITASTPREGLLPPKTLSANLTNFSIVALPHMQLERDVGPFPVAAVSMTVSTEHGDGSAVLWRGDTSGYYDTYFMYCQFQDGSKEIFLWQAKDTY